MTGQGVSSDHHQNVIRIYFDWNYNDFAHDPSGGFLPSPAAGYDTGSNQSDPFVLRTAKAPHGHQTPRRAKRCVDVCLFHHLMDRSPSNPLLYLFSVLQYLYREAAQIIITPAPTRKRGGIKNLFAKDYPIQPSPTFMPRRRYDSLHALSSEQLHQLPEASSHMTNRSHRPAMLTIDVTGTRNKHYRSHSQAPSEGLCPPCLSQRPPYLNPRCTKESIASLGLSRRSPTPDSCPSDSDSMVALCSNNFVESPALPPLPPIPPPKDDVGQELIIEVPPRPPSSLSQVSTHSSRQAHSVDIDEVDVDDDPPSPIIFSNRMSTYFAADSKVEARTQIEIGAQKQPSSPSPSQLSTSNSQQLLHHRTKSIPPVELVAHPWTRFTPISTSVLFAPTINSKPKSKPKPLPQPPSSLAKQCAVLSTLKRFRRRHSVSDTGSVTFPSTSKDSPVNSPAPTLRGTISRSSSISHSTESSIQTIPNRNVSPSPVMQLRDDDGRQIITHAEVGGVWEEKEIEEVIHSLRTMKASGRLTPFNFK
ncbi:hypothetical protein K474DRAFT_1675545 [Panus rudis PR-1116 ss-1]|nr:hypothetical protein K474DRAFT_1675545 [Panus rudis PR-1116 ss-1]